MSVDVFFFFQAEDGIRDIGVTGVQTCALPICYEAAASAKSGDFAQGSVGAGTGATVGKVLGMERAMKGGLGSAAVELAGGLVVGALAAVNAFGGIRDPNSGKILAGPRMGDGTLGDTVELLPEKAYRTRWGEDTTLGVVATSASLSKMQAAKVAQMAHDGLARAIEPRSEERRVG